MLNVTTNGTEDAIPGLTYLDVSKLNNGVNSIASVLQADIARARLAVSQLVQWDNRVHLPHVLGLHHKANVHVCEKLVADRVEHLELLTLSREVTSEMLHIGI